MILKPFHEIIGTLSTVRYENNRIYLSFQMLEEAAIADDDTLHQQLKSLVGKRIGVFNSNGKIKIREIKEEKR